MLTNFPLTNFPTKEVIKADIIILIKVRLYFVPSISSPSSISALEEKFFDKVKAKYKLTPIAFRLMNICKSSITSIVHIPNAV